MAKSLEDKTAVVTGAGRGIGREIALFLAAEGAKVIVNDPGVMRDGTGQDTKPADEVVAEIKKRGGEALPNYESVVDFGAAERIINSCIEKFGRIDILVNVAGILRDRMIFNMSEEEWDAVLDVHLKGTFNCSRHACIPMRKQRAGRIINITSDAWRGTVGHVNYGAAKAGIVGLTRSIAREMGRYNVTCNAIAPVAATRMTLDEDVKQGIKKRYEAGLVTKEQLDAILNMPGPEYVPPIVAYLATDHAWNINGQVFHAEGGRVSVYSEPVETRAIYKKAGIWTVDELIDVFPQTIGQGLINPAPPQPAEKEKKDK
jgi:3-oxoacyl-[acyl-carrier protein] reductase